MLRLINLVIIFLLLSCSWFVPQELEINSTITGNYTVSNGVYIFNGKDSLSQPAITIEANNSVIDFNKSMIIGSSDKKSPDQFKGLGILIKNSNNVVIRSLRIKGYKVAIRIKNSKNIRITDSDISYNYRPKLFSNREREDITDWLSYHNNDQNEWLRYGAAIYIQYSDKVQIDNSHITGQQNGILMTHSNYGLFYNNEIVFNSGLGIGLYQSSYNRIMHNNLNFNVRGYSHGIYQRGQDSAALLLYEQSSHNTIAYNSATHSGDGLFLWAGNTTMKDASGGANDNIIYGNDFSYAPTNGIEVTFSRNVIINNFVDESRYGVWGGYSFESIIHNNVFLNSDYGIAIEHGQKNRISSNVIQNMKKIGVQLWSRESTPDWGFVKNKDTQSQESMILLNSISKSDKGIEVERSKNIRIENNNMYENKTPFSFEANESVVEKNTMNSVEVETDFRKEWLDEVFDYPNDSLSAEYFVQPLIDGMNPFRKYQEFSGRNNIIITEWGPYTFQYPFIHLTTIRSNLYDFKVLGPEGRWRYYSAHNSVLPDIKTGDVPGSVSVLKMTDDEDFSYVLAYTGEEIITEFGTRISKGVSSQFGFSRYRQPLPWTVKWYNIKGNGLNLDFENYLNQVTYVTEERTNFIEYRWWDSSKVLFNKDQFLTVAETHGFFEKGTYIIGITSDDGVRLVIDGIVKFVDWSIHEPKHDEIEVELNGRHKLQLFHFDNSGFATLNFTMKIKR